MTRAHIEVVLTMTLDDSVALERHLADLPGDHPTDDIYQALKVANRKAETALAL